MLLIKVTNHAAHEGNQSCCSQR